MKNIACIILLILLGGCDPGAAYGHVRQAVLSAGYTDVEVYDIEFGTDNTICENVGEFPYAFGAKEGGGLVCVGHDSGARIVAVTNVRN